MKLTGNECKCDVSSLLDILSKWETKYGVVYSVGLDVTSCLDFSCLYRFHSTFAVSLLDNFWLSVLHFSCPNDRFEILWHQRQWSPFVFGWL